MLQLESLLLLLMKDNKTGLTMKGIRGGYVAFFSALIHGLMLFIAIKDLFLTCVVKCTT